MIKYLIFIVTEKFTFLIAQTEWEKKEQKVYQLLTAGKTKHC